MFTDVSGNVLLPSSEYISKPSVEKYGTGIGRRTAGPRALSEPIAVRKEIKTDS
jgi:hypothetical protein